MKKYNFRKALLFACVICFMCNNSNVYAQNKEKDEEEFRKLCNLYAKQNAASAVLQNENIDGKDAQTQHNEILTGEKSSEPDFSDIEARLRKKNAEKQREAAKKTLDKMVLYISSGKDYKEAINIAEKDTDFAVDLYNALEEKKRELDRIKTAVNEYNNLTIQYHAKKIKYREWENKSIVMDKNMPGSIVWQDKNKSVPLGLSKDFYDNINKNYGNIGNALKAVNTVCEDCNAK